MPPEIETYSSPVPGVAIVCDGYTDPIFVIPFRDGSLSRTYVLDERTLLFVGRASWRTSVPTLLLAKYDLVQRRIIQRNILPDVLGQTFVLSADKQLLYALCHAVHVVSTTSLDLQKTYQVAIFDGQRGRLTNRAETGLPRPNDLAMQWLSVYYLGDSEAGRIGLIQTFDTHDENGHQRFLTALDVDLKSDQFSACPLISGIVSDDPLTPSTDAFRVLHVDFERSICITPATSLVPFSSGTRNARFEVFGTEIPQIAIHPDLKLDGVKRFGASVQFLDFSGPEVKAQTHITRMASAADWMLPEPALLFRIASLSASSGKNWSAIASEPWSEALKYYPLGNPLTRHITRLIKDPHTGNMWLVFSDQCFRSLGPSGEIGPLIMPGGEIVAGDSEIVFHPGGEMIVRVPNPSRMKNEYKIHAAQIERRSGPILINMSREVKYFELPRFFDEFCKFAERKTTKRYKLVDWSAEECNAALLKQAKLVEKKYANLIDSEFRLKFDYVVAGERLDEEAFYQRLLDLTLPVTNALHELLKSYLIQIGEGGEGNQPWQADEGIAALGSAMRALVLMDPNTVDVLREYLAKRDFEHESYCWRVVLPELFSTHGIKNMNMLGFGVFAAFNQISGQGLDESFDRWGLMRAAPGLASAVEFADILLSEVEPFGLRPQWGFKTDDYLAQFAEFFDENDQYQAEVLRELANRRPGFWVPKNG